MPPAVAELSILKSSSPITEHYRCPEVSAFHLSGSIKGTSGFFRFGEDVVCYGHAAGQTRSTVNGHLYDAEQEVRLDGSGVLLPFEIREVVNNLRYESYVQSNQRWLETSWVKDIYHRLRPMFPLAFRKHLQKIYLSGWDRMSFPAWPVDRTVDQLFEKLLALSMQALGVERLPFIWFWPDGHKACAIVGHDVETKAGRDFCHRLMGIDDEFGIKASFQIVPEKRYAVAPAFLQEIRDGGFEVNVHGLNHEGNLFDDRKKFLKSAAKINRYAEEYGSLGFRSPVLYRNVDWLQDLRFSYDMSVPNVARLEPQRGGCCTVLPYFLPGGMIELPLTTTEDYSLLHILKDYSTTLWKQQMNAILDGHGLMNFIVHPDYMLSDRAQGVFKSLLEELCRQQAGHKVWMPLPKEVDRWWRERSGMQLVPQGAEWRIDGPGSDRASMAYVRLDGDRLVYEFC